MASKKEDDPEILAKIRTLLALERNYLAEERTAFSKLRTGLALVLIGPAASALVIYLFSLARPLFSMEASGILDWFNIAFFSAVTIAGLWMSLSSQAELRKIRRKKKLLKARETEIVQNSKAAKDLLGDFLNY